MFPEWSAKTPKTAKISRNLQQSVAAAINATLISNRLCSSLKSLFQ
jgi:hypothetical protein